MTKTDLLWWAALVVQLLAIPGTLLPVLPGLVLLPLGALLWCWAVGFGVAWPVLLVAVVLVLMGWGAEALGVVLGAARLQASRWAYGGAALGLSLGVLGLLPALPVGGPLLGALVGPLLGASLGELVAELGPGRRDAPGRLDLAAGRGALVILGRSLTVGLAVVSGMLVSRLAQMLLAVVGVAAFVLLSLWGPAAA
jgi:uncharacterized protein YqgC (DUF456 family)